MEVRSEVEMIEGVRSRLLEAVRLRLQADVPVGIFLSGGVDSSVIAGMAKHLHETSQVKLGAGQGAPKQLMCLGIGFAGTSGYDESGNASIPCRPHNVDVPAQRSPRAQQST